MTSTSPPVNRGAFGPQGNISDDSIAVAPIDPTRPWRKHLRALEARIEGISLWLLLGFLCLAAAWTSVGRHLPWPAFRQEVLAGVGFVLFFFAAWLSRARVAWPGLAFAAIALAAVPLLQYRAGQVFFFGDAVVCALYLAAFGLSVALGATLADSPLREQARHGLLCCLLAVGLASTALALAQWLGPSWLDAWMEIYPARARPTANLGQPNLLATQLILGMLAALLLFEQRRLIGRWAAGAISAMAFGVVISQSRTAWVMLAVIFVAWVLLRNRAGLHTRPAAAPIALVLFIAMVLAAPAFQVLWQGPNDLDETQRVRTHVGTRLGHWQTLWAALLRSPWGGYGWNQVSNAQFETAGEFPTINEWTLHSHNLVLDMLIYNGLPLGLLVCAGLGAWFVRQVVRCRCAEGWCVLMMVAALFVHALFEYPLHYSYYLLPAGLLMGWLGSLNRRSGDRNRRAPRMTLAAPATALAALAGAISIEYVDAEQALRELQLAIVHVGKPASDLPTPQWIFNDGWAAYHRAAAVKVSPGMPAEEIENLARLARRYSYPNMLERYALATALNGQAEAARHALRHSCKVHSVAICAGMQRRWKLFQDELPELRGVAFPTLLN